MKPINCILFSLIIAIEAIAQSSIVFDTGTIIEVSAGADICADDVTIQGTYTGAGTLCEGPLPVELSLFEAKLTKNEIKLFWKTETEVDNYGFEVERKMNEGEWAVLKFIHGSGNSNSPKEYSYVDKDLFAGGIKFGYRLKQIDTDGNYEYSNVVEVGVIPHQFELFQNYPNPFNPVTTIRYSVPEISNVNLKVYDILGNEIITLVNKEMLPGNYDIDFNANDLATGTYIYKLLTDNYMSIKKMILIR